MIAKYIPNIKTSGTQQGKEVFDYLGFCFGGGFIACLVLVFFPFCFGVFFTWKK